MAKFERRQYEAFRWAGENTGEIIIFAKPYNAYTEWCISRRNGERVVSITIEAFHILRMEVGDWLVKDHRGEYSVISDERFREEYISSDKEFAKIEELDGVFSDKATNAVYFALRKAGLDRDQAINSIDDMREHGVVFLKIEG